MIWGFELMQTGNKGTLREQSTPSIAGLASNLYEGIWESGGSLIAKIDKVCYFL